MSPEKQQIAIGRDCCGKEIIPLLGKKLEVRTNRHTTTDGYLWGWIEGTTANTVWSDDHKFNHAAAVTLVRDYNAESSAKDEGEDHETAEQKVAWLTEILVTKAGDSVFTDYWLRLARRNLLLGLPLKTEEPDLNLATEESSATDHFRDATKMVSGESSAPTPTQPNP